MSNLRDDKKVLLGCFIVSLVIRIAYLYEQSVLSPISSVLTLDEIEMATVARRLLQGEGFGETPLFKAPLYPLMISFFMRLFDDSWLFFLKFFQHICGSLLVVLGASLACRLVDGDRKKMWAGLLAGGVLAFYGPLIRLEHRIVLDFMTVFWQSLLLYILFRLRTKCGALMAGFIAALCLLNRPTLLPILPLLSIWLGFRLRSTRVSFIFLLPVVLAVLGMGLRNWNASQEWLVTPWQGGYNFYEANRAGASGRYLKVSNASFTDVDNPTLEFATKPYLKERGLSEVDSYKQVNQFWYAQAKDDILRDPLSWLGLLFKKGLYLLNAREVFNFEDYRVQRSMSGVLGAMLGGFGLIWPLALAGLLGISILAPTQKEGMILLWLYVVSLGVCIALFFACGRMRMPLVWPLAVLAGVSASWLVDGLRRTEKFLPWIALLLIGAVISWGDWWGVRSERTEGLEYLRVSNAMWQVGDSESALAYAEHAEHMLGGYPTLPQLKAQALYELDRIEEAEEEFKKSIQMLEEDPVAPFNLACLYLYKQYDLEKALSQVDVALSRSSRYPRAEMFKIRLLMHLGRSEEARASLAQGRARFSIASSGSIFDWMMTQFFVAEDMNEKERLLAQIQQSFGVDGLSRLQEELAFFE